MSYDITFIKRSDLNTNNIVTILETKVSQSDVHFLSLQEKHLIKEKLIQLGLQFETFENKDHIELNFDSFQISFDNSQITLSVPYWNKNETEKVNHDIKTIMKELIDWGFTGYDQQTDTFINEKENIKFGFSYTTKSSSTQTNTQKESNIVYYLLRAALIVGIIYLTKNHL